MNHITLKSAIRIATATTRAQRAEATKLLSLGRDLRKQSRDEKDATRKARLNTEGEGCRTLGLNLRSQADKERWERRHMHLAAGLLNGKTYLQCEAKVGPAECDKPSAARLAHYIREHLPKAEQKHAEYIAKAWLTEGTTRMQYIREHGLIRLLAQDKKEAEISRLQDEIKKAESAWKDATSKAKTREQEFKSAQKEATSKEDILTALKTRIAHTEAELRRERESFAREGQKTSSLDEMLAAA